MSKERDRIVSVFSSYVGNMSNTDGKVRAKSTANAKALFQKNPWLKSCTAYKKFQKLTGTAPAPSKFDDPWPVQVSRKFLQLWKSAKKRNKGFDLSLKDVARLLRVKKCYYTGVALTTEIGNYKLTIDRVNNDKGYTKDNVVACCHLANQIKNELFERPTGELRANIEFVRNLISKL